MTGQPPPLDGRDRQQIIDRTTELAGQYSGWQPRTDGGPDAGRALIGIFGRFAELVIQRLNGALDRNYLAFLNLIGTRPLPPLPARVPLTFSLAERSPAEAVVPEGTQVAAAQLEGETDEVVFETDRSLVVTRAQLSAVFVGDAEHDTYADRFTEATTGVPFAAFEGADPLPHQLFIACDPVLTDPGEKDVVLIATTPAAALLASWPISWSYWDGSGWHTAASQKTVSDGALRVTLARLPQLTSRAVNGIQAGWLRAELAMALSPGESGLPPESVAVGGKAPTDEVAGLYPFGETAQVKWLYLSADETIAAGGATVRFDVRLARPGVARTAVKLVWTYKVGSEWRELGGLVDETRALTRDGEIRFRVPTDWPREVFRGRIGRWLRVEIADAGGSYDTLPRLATLTAGYSWDLPSITRITVQSQLAPVPVTPPAAFANSSPIDLSAPHYPFGEQPRFTDTYYLACPENLAKAGVAVNLTVRLAVPGRADGNPRIAWEVFDSTGWHPLLMDKAYAFTGDATVKLTLPAGFAKTSVNGVEQFWLRARIAGGNYGVAASYREKPDGLFRKNPDGTYVPNPGGAFEPVAATFSPPVIAALSFTPDRAPSTPVLPSALVTHNDFRYATQVPPLQPFAPGADADPALYLGFDQPFAPRPVTIYLQVEPPAPEEVAADRLADLAGGAELIWEYSAPAGWQPLAAVDETDRLAGRGLVQFIGPGDLVERSCFGQRWHWLRLRWRRGEFPVPPRLRRVLPNTMWATQASTVAEEILGSGTLDAGQTFTAAQTPVLNGQRLVVREQSDELWVPWDEVKDFYGSGPGDRHYTVDRQSGEIRFGDGKAGLMPPRGENNIRLTYRTGGGAAGNRDPESITTLKSALPFVDSVTNHELSQGGSPAEPPDRLRARGPRMLRHRDRAVTVDDLEDLAFESATEVARVRAVLPSRFDPFNLWLDPADPRPGAAHTDTDAGVVGMIVVPDSASPRPAPSLGLLRQVQDYLRARLPATAGLWVAGPEWLRVTVTATVVPVSPEVAEPVRGRVRDALTSYLHPLTGGPSGDGWAFGRKPHRSDLFAVAEGVSGVDHVRSLEVDQLAESEELGERLGIALNRSLAEGAALPPAADLRLWLHRALVYSGPHAITVTLRG